jgi:hypothetical protein
MPCFDAETKYPLFLTELKQGIKGKMVLNAEHEKSK